uniref:B-cell receptor CD22 n=1 Tax=Xenopus tropicalis TaxID=8364 RepID=A0A1B8Y6Z7_XENTR
MQASFCYSVRTDDHVNFPEQISAWTGSCVLIPCYEKDNRRINNFLWYQNPEYDDDKKQWTRTVVYDNKNTKKVDSHFEGRVKPYVGQGNGACGIVLHNVQEGDSGYYRLRTIDGNDQWMTKKNVSLTVSDSGPELMIRPVGVGREYQKLTLSCYVHYYCPDYDIKLSWDGDVRGETKTTVPRLEWSVRNKKPIMTEAEFTFTPTWEDHNKTIQCALTKGDSEVTKTGPVVLNIQYSPKGVRIRPETSPVTISKGEEVALECTAESSNPPIDTYRWYKSANNIVGSNSHYSARESGTYYCEAENTIGRTRSKGVAINVLYAPTVTLKIPSREIREGSQYTLTCSVDANPQPVNITWYKDYEKILNKNRDTLTFPTIREQDSGSYRCKADNIIGSESSADVYVDVVYAPKNPEVVVEPKKPSFVEGSSLRFSCNVNSSNPGVSQFTWYKNEKVMASERPLPQTWIEVVMVNIKMEPLNPLKKS